MFSGFWSNNIPTFLPEKLNHFRFLNSKIKECLYILHALKVSTIYILLLVLKMISYQITTSTVENHIYCAPTMNQALL